MLGDLMRWWVRSAVGIWFCFCPSERKRAWTPFLTDRVFFSNNTPGFCFNAHNSQQWQYERWAAFFNLVPPLRITRKVERRKSLKREIWIMVKRKLTVGGLIGHLASVSHYHKNKREAKINTSAEKYTPVSFFVVPRAISIWNIIPGSLLPHFK